VPLVAHKRQKKKKKSKNPFWEGGRGGKEIALTEERGKGRTASLSVFFSILKRD